MKLSEIIIQSAEAALNVQRGDGSFPPGHNGPYHDKGTPVRNTAHWLITFLKSYEITGEKKFLRAAEKAIDYLLSKEARPFGYTFHNRDPIGKDKCNGLIGQAWVIEALLTAAKTLKREDLSKLAEEIFLLQPFDDGRGLWHVREIDGKTLPLDRTFNHQLWFAAAGSMFDKAKYPEIQKQVKIFTEELNVNFDILKNGLIRHLVVFSNRSRRAGFKKMVRSLLKNHTLRKPEDIYRGIGYHQFNLYGFGILKENYPKISFWQSPKFQKAVEYIQSSEFKEGLIDNKFGFPYNVAGIETAFALKMFVKNSDSLQKGWLDEQFKRNFSFDDNFLNKNTDDPLTLAARLYEATRLQEMVIFS